MGRLNQIESQFNSIIENNTVGFSVLKSKGERYSFKALCEAAYAVHTAHISNDNLAHKEALKEIVLTVSKESVDKKIKLTETKIQKDVEAGIVGVGLNLFTNFTKILKMIWKHIKLFVLSFFDVGAKVQLAHSRLNGFLERVKRDAPDFKTFLRTRVENLQGVIPHKKGTYVNTIKDITNIADEITEGFRTLHEKIERTLKGKVVSFLKGDKSKYKFEEAELFTDKSSKKIGDIKGTVFFKKGTEAEPLKGENIFMMFRESTKALEYVFNTPPGSSTNLLDIMKKTKERTKDDALDQLIEDTKENFLKMNGQQSKEILDSLTASIRKSNALLVEINGVSKIKMGELIQVGMTTMKTIKKYAKLDKLAITKIRTENELNINLRTDGKDLLGKAAGAVVNRIGKKKEEF